MTLQDWGSIGELVGGVAVIITLIYLAIQIREYRLGMSSATYIDAMPPNEDSAYGWNLARDGAAPK